MKIVIVADSNIENRKLFEAMARIGFPDSKVAAVGNGADLTSCFRNALDLGGKVSFVLAHNDLPIISGLDAIAYMRWYEARVSGKTSIPMNLIVESYYTPEGREARQYGPRLGVTECISTEERDFMDKIERLINFAPKQYPAEVLVD